MKPICKLPNFKDRLALFSFKDRASENKDFQSLSEKLKAVEGKCRERTFGTAYDVLDAIYEVSLHFQNFTNEEKEGLFIEIFSNAQKFASAYTFTGCCTKVFVEFKRGKWNVHSVSRFACPQKNKFVVKAFSEKAKEKAIKLFFNF